MARILNTHNEVMIFINEGKFVRGIDFDQKFIIVSEYKRWEVSAKQLLEIMEQQKIELPFGIIEPLEV